MKGSNLPPEHTCVDLVRSERVYSCFVIHPDTINQICLERALMAGSWACRVDGCSCLFWDWKIDCWFNWLSDCGAAVDKTLQMETHSSAGQRNGCLLAFMVLRPSHSTSSIASSGGSRKLTIVSKAFLRSYV